VTNRLLRLLIHQLDGTIRRPEADFVVPAMAVAALLQLPRETVDGEPLGALVMPRQSGALPDAWRPRMLRTLPITTSRTVPPSEMLQVTLCSSPQY
jgi:hypothetical protein